MTDSFCLKNKIALVTGGASGIGAATCRELTRAGASVLIADLNLAAAQSLAAAFEIMQRMSLRSCIVVSDGYHIFRAKKYLQAEGLTVFGSPRASIRQSEWKAWWEYFRQAVGFTLWQIGLAV